MFLRRFSTQIIKDVNPFSKIKIDSRISYKIKPFDLFECQDSNKLRASFDDPNKTENVDKFLKINVKNEHVEIHDTDAASPANLNCILEVPVKSDLTIKTKNDVTLSDLYSDLLDIEAKNIHVKNLHGTEVKLTSKNGQITSEGLLLGKQIRLFLENSNLSLDRIQGEKLIIKQLNGNVKISSCYSTFSQFDCTNSDLNLKNMHKLCHINAHGKGNLTMHGFSGTLIADLEDYLLNLQFSELLQRSKITCKSERPSVINLASQILENCYVKMRAIKMSLDEELTKLNLSTNGEHIRINDRTFANHLRIYHANEVKLGKLSWEDAFNFNGIENKFKLKSKGQ
uniref:CSON006689 protein n=1 Tax=Culicoides sonorensis TaxID=179676 RepID=A0A336LBC9_CULSO